MNKSVQILINNIEELNAERGWSQRRLAAEAGVTSASISNYLAGKKIPQLDALNRIANAFNVPITRLLSAPDDENVVIKHKKIQPTTSDAIEILRKDLSFLSRMPDHVRAMLAKVSGEEDWKKLERFLEKLVCMDDGDDEEPPKKPRSQGKDL